MGFNSGFKGLKLEVGQFALRSINISVLLGIKRNCLSSGKSRSLYLFKRKVIKQTVVNRGEYQFRQLHTKFYPTSCCQGYFHMQRKLLGIINVYFNATYQLLITYSAFVKYLKKNGNAIKMCISHL